MNIIWIPGSPQSVYFATCFSKLQVKCSSLPHIMRPTTHSECVKGENHYKLHKWINKELLSSLFEYRFYFFIFFFVICIRFCAKSHIHPEILMNPTGTGPMLWAWLTVSLAPKERKEREEKESMWRASAFNHTFTPISKGTWLVRLHGVERKTEGLFISVCLIGLLSFSASALLMLVLGEWLKFHFWPPSSYYPSFPFFYFFLLFSIVIDHPTPQFHRVTWPCNIWLKKPPGESPARLDICSVEIKGRKCSEHYRCRYRFRTTGAEDRFIILNIPGLMGCPEPPMYIL